jgi:hypothetical protein
MMTRSLMLEAAAAVCVLGIASPRPAAAEVSEEAFKALQEAVQNLTQERAEDRKKRAEDQQKIQQLEERLTEALKAPKAQPAAGAVSGEQFDSLKSAVDRLSQQAAASSGPFALQNFMLVGDGEIKWAKTGGQHGAFALADFAPVFLYRASDKVLFEAGFDVMLQNNPQDSNPSTPGYTTMINLSFAQLDYVISPCATFVGGLMVLPLGTYSERSAGWLNKLPDDPLSRGLLQNAGVGVQLRGAVPVDNSGHMVTYAVYAADGPSSTSSTGAAAGSLDLTGNVGVLNNGTTANLHGAPSGGGRIGWFLPWKGHDHYDVELGISGQRGVWNNAGNHLWSACVLDAALHLGPSFEAKGELIKTWEQTDDHGTVFPRGGWVQASYKLAGLDLEWPLVNDIELVGRFDTIRDGLGMRTDKYSLGYVYYFTNTLLLRGAYEFLTSTDPTQAHDEAVLELSYGF